MGGLTRHLTFFLGVPNVRFRLLVGGVWPIGSKETAFCQIQGPKTPKVTAPPNNEQGTTPPPPFSKFHVNWGVTLAQSGQSSKSRRCLCPSRRRTRPSSWRCSSSRDKPETISAHWLQGVNWGLILVYHVGAFGASDAKRLCQTSMTTLCAESAFLTVCSVSRSDGTRRLIDLYSI